MKCSKCKILLNSFIGYKQYPSYRIYRIMCCVCYHCYFFKIEDNKNLAKKIFNLLKTYPLKELGSEPLFYYNAIHNSVTHTGSGYAKKQIINRALRITKNIDIEPIHYFLHDPVLGYASQ